MKLRKSKYDLSSYNLKCPVCERISKNKKCFTDHIFHRNWKDEKHKEFAKHLREKSEKEFLKNAKKECPICKKPLMNHLATHLNNSKDDTHKQFYNNQKDLVIKYFFRYKSTYDMEKIQGIFLDRRWIYRYLNRILGRKQFLDISKEIQSMKARNRWSIMPVKERKKKMSKVRGTGWANLSQEERRNHPWVIAGRKASLKSSIRGSKNQKYAFELLKNKAPNFNWKYNYIINENWQIDIASPKQKIYIEWDGRHHRVDIHGKSYLNNRKNRDKVKDKMITENLAGCMIRIKDDGRFDEEFVKNKVEEIIILLSDDKVLPNKVIRL